MPGEQIKRWGFNDYRGLSTTALLYHAEGKIDSINKVLGEIWTILSRNTVKTGNPPSVLLSLLLR